MLLPDALRRDAISSAETFAKALAEIHDSAEGTRRLLEATKTHGDSAGSAE